MNANAVVLDVEFVPDLDADSEMGATTKGELITDEEIRGSRLLVVRKPQPERKGQLRKIQKAELECSFQPAPGLRFSWARVVVTLTNPPGSTFIDIEPKKVSDPVKVTFTVEDTGKIKVGIPKLGAEVGGKTGVDREYETYACRVNGAGDGSARATWTFDEDPLLRSGLGPNQTLAMTFAADKPIVAKFDIRATIARSGLAGAVRELVLGQTKTSRAVSLDLWRP